jgi:phospholipid-binding lipoprotein MlaA
MSRRARKSLLGAALLLAAAAVQAQQPPAVAASAPADARAADAAGDPRDPFERFNRGVFAFNEAVDAAVLAPLARGYRAVVPQPLRSAVSNFFGNFGDAWSAVNLFLQAKPAAGLEMGMRVATNSVLGIGGLLDIASEAGIERRNEDFGQTLGHWGMPAGPYLVLPLLGPSAVRETAALPLDRAWSPALAFSHDADMLAITLLGVLDTRASLLDASRVLDDVALDKYSFLRDAYLARRRNLVHDGNPPDEEQSDTPPARKQ